MPRGLRFALVLSLLPASSVHAGEVENWERLRAIPLEERVILGEKIREFDRLDRSEKRVVRDIDAKVEALPPADRANYRSVLRRYHVWLRSLPPDKQKIVEAAPPDQRIALIGKFRAEEPAAAKETADPSGLKLTDLSGPPALDMARLLKTWLELSPEERAEIAKKDVSERQNRLRELALKKKTKLQHLNLSESEVDEIMTKLESNPRWKSWLPGAPKNGPAEKNPEKAREKVAKNRQRLAENYYSLIHPPKPVDPENLFRFEAELPAWVRAPFDLLPPENARRRLTVLYRLIYPAPEEMPKPVAKPAAKSATPAAAPTPPAGSAPSL